ncbi:hypothetical protein HDK77DRAFT_322700 [Phyllosticta capitalensis]
MSSSGAALWHVASRPESFSHIHAAPALTTCLFGTNSTSYSLFTFVAIQPQSFPSILSYHLQLLLTRPACRSSTAYAKRPPLVQRLRLPGCFCIMPEVWRIMHSRSYWPCQRFVLQLDGTAVAQLVFRSDCQWLMSHGVVLRIRDQSSSSFNASSRIGTIHTAPPSSPSTYLPHGQQGLPACLPSISLLYITPPSLRRTSPTVCSHAIRPSPRTRHFTSSRASPTFCPKKQSSGMLLEAWVAWLTVVCPTAVGLW